MNVFGLGTPRECNLAELSDNTLTGQMHFRSLREWETEFRRGLNQVDLLGELCPTEQDVLELGRQIGSLVKQRPNWNSAAQSLRDEFPLCYTVFLVGVGMYRYADGDFWSDVCTITGITTSLSSQRWGELFEEIVKTLPVAQFPLTTGHRYVGQILAHGGIPQARLADFFDHVLRPLLYPRGDTALTVEDFLHERLSLSSLATYIGRPAVRFLKYGGNVAVDFVERCREMAIQADQGIEQPSPELVGLRPHVVHEFLEWRSRQDKSSTASMRVRPPSLLLKPWDEGVCLCLPAQSLPDLGGSVEWQIASGALGDQPRIVEPSQWRTCAGREVKSHYEPLSALLETYTIRLVLRQGDEVAQELGCWDITPVQEGHPVLWFDPSSGKAIRRQEWLPKKPLWVLRSPDVTLEPAGLLTVLEQLPSIWAQEGEFVVEAVDLERVSDVSALSDGLPKDQWHVGRRPLLLLPEGNVLEGARCGDIAHVFVGEFPRVRMHWEGENNLGHWRFVVSRQHLPVRKESTVEFKPEQTETVVELSQVPQGESWVGTYRLTALGPLGLKAELEFAVLPQLEIVGQEDVLDPANCEQAKLLIEADTATEIISASIQTCVRLESETSTRRLYEVIAPLTERHVELQVKHQAPDGRLENLPLSIPVRCLRWRVVLDQSTCADWSVQAIELPLRLLEQSKNPALVVDTSGVSEVRSELELVACDSEGKAIQRQRVEPSQKSGVAFKLGAFLDTLRNQAEPATLTLETKLKGKAASYPALRVSPCFVAQHPTAEYWPAPPKVRLVLRWTAPAGRHRLVARLASVWRPWEGTVVVSIPDTAQGEHEEILPAGRLIPGKYLLRIASEESWRNAECVERQHGCTILLPDDAAAHRRVALEHAISHSGGDFADHLEMAYLKQDVGESPDEYLARCFERVDEGTFAQVLALADLVRGREAWEELLRCELSAPRRVRRLLEAYQQSQINELVLRRYLSCLATPDRWDDETCELLLAVQDVQREALEQVVRRQREGWIRHIVKCTEAGWLTEREAVEKLSLHPERAASELNALLSTCPVALRILEGLSRIHPEHTANCLVWHGYWLRCAAGWGRIEQIDSERGTLPYLLPRHLEPGLKLRILLRAGIPDAQEEAVISLDEQKLYLLETHQAYQCTRCNHFISCDQQRIVGDHVRAVHEGIGPAFRPIKLPVPAWVGEPVFRPDSPAQLFE